MRERDEEAVGGPLVGSLRAAEEGESPQTAVEAKESVEVTSGEEPSTAMSDEAQAQAQQEEQTNEATTKKEQDSTAEGWLEYLDASTQQRYYHNAQTDETTWEAPPKYKSIESQQSELEQYQKAQEEYQRQLRVYQQQQQQLQRQQYVDYSSTAYFSSRNGSYSGSNTYWQQVGRPDDKAGRQLSAFIDLQDLERNRAETAQKKAEFQQQMRGTDWKRLKQEQKAQKKRNRDQWLNED